MTDPVSDDAVAGPAEVDVLVSHLTGILDTLAAIWASPPAWRCARAPASASRHSVDPARMLLTGISDGGTFTLLSGLTETSPFTYLAPVAASFHPLLMDISDPARTAGLPVYLVHGARDWMFPVDVARTASRVLSAAGARVRYREIAELSRAYPAEENELIIDWLLGPAERLGAAAPVSGS